jgi:hypothetical protein
MTQWTSVDQPVLLSFHCERRVQVKLRALGSFARSLVFARVQG